jgi:uncharacterized membrane protein
MFNKPAMTLDQKSVMALHSIEKKMKIHQWIDTRTLTKTASYWVVHVSVAALVAYAITHDFITSLTLSLLEPTVQAFAFFFHEKVWENRLLRSVTPPRKLPTI